MNSQKYRQIIEKESEILTFGKFKHKTVQFVLRTEPSYLLWLDSEKIVKLPLDIIHIAEDRVDDERIDEDNRFANWHDFAEY